MLTFHRAETFETLQLTYTGRERQQVKLATMKPQQSIVQWRHFLYPTFFVLDTLQIVVPCKSKF